MDDLPPLPDLGPMWTDYWLAKVNGLLIAYGKECAIAAVLAYKNRCRYPECLDNEDERCTRWLTGECGGPDTAAIRKGA